MAPTTLACRHRTTVAVKKRKTRKKGNRQVGPPQRVWPAAAAGRRVEVKRGQDFNNPGSQDQDPIFSNYRLPKHEARAGRHKKTIQYHCGR